MYTHQTNSFCTLKSWSKEFYFCDSPGITPASCSHFRVLQTSPRGDPTGSAPQRVARKTSFASLRAMPPTNFSFRAKMSTQTWPFLLRPESLDRSRSDLLPRSRTCMLCKSVGRIVDSSYGERECPAAQKVSYLRPPSQLSIPRPTERPTCCFSKRPLASGLARPRSVVPHNRRGLSFSWLWRRRCRAR